MRRLRGPVGALHCTGPSDSRNEYSVSDHPSSRGPTNPRMGYQIGKNALPVITGPIIPTGWLWAMPQMMPVPNCCPGNAGYRPCRFPSGGRKIPGIEYVPFSCLHNTLVNFMSVV